MPSSLSYSIAQKHITGSAHSQGEGIIQGQEHQATGIMEATVHIYNLAKYASEFSFSVSLNKIRTSGGTRPTFQSGSSPHVWTGHSPLHSGHAYLSLHDAALSLCLFPLFTVVLVSPEWPFVVTVSP